MNLLDVAIAAVLVLFVLSVIHKGFMYTAISVLCMIVCMMLAFIIMPLISHSVVENESVFNSMLYYTEGSEYIYDVELRKLPITSIDKEDLTEVYNRSDAAAPMDPAAGMPEGMGPGGPDGMAMPEGMGPGGPGDMGPGGPGGPGGSAASERRHGRDRAAGDRKSVV